MARGTTSGVVNDDGTVEVQVANKRIARLIQLGVHAEKEAKLKAARKRMVKMSRKANRSK